MAFDTIRHDVISRKPLLPHETSNSPLPSQGSILFGTPRPVMAGWEEDNSCIELWMHLEITSSPQRASNFSRKVSKEFICMKLKCSDSEKSVSSDSICKITDNSTYMIFMEEIELSTLGRGDTSALLICVYYSFPYFHLNGTFNSIAKRFLIEE